MNKTIESVLILLYVVVAGIGWVAGILLLTFDTVWADIFGTLTLIGVVFLMYDMLIYFIRKEN